MESIEFLKKLCILNAPSGKEYKLHSYIKNSFKEFGEIKSDEMNNIYVHKKGEKKGSIMLMAHADEVALIITEILPKGFLKFKGIGIDSKTLVSQEVTIHGKNDIPGVIGIKIKGEDKSNTITMENMLIDTGLTTEEIEKTVKVGDMVTLKRDFYNLLNNNVASKAIDDRAGIVSMYECAKQLQESKHDLDVYFVCSCQEEVGHRGAKMASYNLNPDIGIAIDVTFDGGNLGDTDRENTLGKGTVVCVGPNIHPKVREKIMDIAEKYNISYGVEVEPGNTGSDAWDIQVARKGIATLLISIPIKYMHTSVELANMEDIKNTGKLIARFIEEIKSEDLEELLCF